MRKEIDHTEIYLKDKDLVQALGQLAGKLIMRPDQIITQQQAAKLRGCKRQRINQLVNQGRIRSTKIGNQIMVLREDVENVSIRPYNKKSDYWNNTDHKSYPSNSEFEVVTSDAE
jgi:excisionase family DNA binding protein